MKNHWLAKREEDKCDEIVFSVRFNCPSNGPSWIERFPCGSKSMYAKITYVLPRDIEGFVIYDYRALGIIKDYKHWAIRKGDTLILVPTAMEERTELSTYLFDAMVIHQGV